MPKIILGNCHKDTRGKLFYNNDFDASVIKRIYVIENESIDTVRSWRGHKIEQRWFSAINGSFLIELIAIDNWDSPSKDLEKQSFILQSSSLDILHVPSGYVCNIKSLEDGGKLMIMANYGLYEVDDNYEFSNDYFE